MLSHETVMTARGFQHLTLDEERSLLRMRKGGWSSGYRS